jgi:hypothetical protein
LAPSPNLFIITFTKLDWYRILIRIILGRRIRIRIEVKSRELGTLTIEPWKPILEPWRLNKEPRRLTVQN